MTVAFTTQMRCGARSFEVNSWLFLGGVISVLVGVFFLGGVFNGSAKILAAEFEQKIKYWNGVLDGQDKEILAVSLDVSGQLGSLSDRVALLQERLVRLDAVGEHLISRFSFNKGEFDFSWEPSIASHSTQLAHEKYATVPSLLVKIAQLSEKIVDRKRQFGLLHQLLREEQIGQEATVTGLPVAKGRRTSRFGTRIDPFTGTVSMHRGVDFAEKAGTGIISVASGLVTYVGYRGSYGLLIEINHGNGYTTRYAHNQSANVDIGDVVIKGQQVACMGNSGRSTGDHLHFEVLLHGEFVDPEKFLYGGGSFSPQKESISG